MQRTVFLPADSVLTVSCGPASSAAVSRVLSPTLSGAPATIAKGGSQTYGPFRSSRQYVINGAASAQVSQSTTPSVPLTYASASGAIAIADQTVLITAACELTLAAPAVADDGVIIDFTTTAAAVVTLTTAASGLASAADGASLVNTATFAEEIGSSLRLLAANGKWNVLGRNEVTFSVV